MRHIILEGPDGGGKTRLLEAFQVQYPLLVRGQKASTSLKGPVKNLAAWVTTEFKVMDGSIPVMIYDRHPVISEPIYGPIARGGAQPGFSPSPWLSSARLEMYSRTYVIWCIPPLEQCQKAVAADRDMPGVTENIDELHAAYLRAMHEWTGPGMRYDLTRGTREVLSNGLFSSAVDFAKDFDYVMKEHVQAPWLRTS